MDNKEQELKSTISIIVPVFNREDTIHRCIDSIIESKYTNIEIVIVDDGSIDKSWEYITSYKDSRIKYVHTENRGLPSARNTGIELASGEYIQFLDSDDYITNEICQKCSEVINKYKPDILMFDYGVYFEEDKKQYDSLPKPIEQNAIQDRKYILENILPVLANLDSRKEMFIENFCVNKLYKREILNKYNIRFDESRKRWEDRIFQMEYLKYAQTFYYLPYNGYYYVQGHSCFSKRYDPDVFKYILEAKNDYKNIVYDVLKDKQDFDSEYTNNYYCRRLINTIVLQLGIPNIDTKLLCDDISKTLFSARAQEMFCRFSPENKFEKKLQVAINNKDIDKIYEYFQGEYNGRLIEQKKAERKQKRFLYRAWSRLKRIIKEIYKGI